MLGHTVADVYGYYWQLAILPRAVHPMTGVLPQWGKAYRVSDQILRLLRSHIMFPVKW